MKKKLIVSTGFILFTLLAVSCSDKQAEGDAVVIPFADMENAAYSELPDNIFEEAEYIVLAPEAPEYALSGIDKVVVSDGKYYVLDMIGGTVTSYDSDGAPIFKLNRKGRGSGEYLMISDFAVGDDGDYYILDGRKDQLLHYLADGTYSESTDIPFQASGFTLLDNGKWLWDLSVWDDSEFAGKRMVVTDASLNAETSMLEYDKALADPNFEFPSAGFNSAGKSILYHRPVSDYVYRLNQNGEITGSWFFDFGAKAVPDGIKAHVEENLEQFSKYNTMIKSVYIDDNTAIGSLFTGAINDFIINIKDGIVYSPDEDFGRMMLISVSDGKAVYYIVPDGESIPGFVPEEVSSKASASDDILLVLNCAKLF